MEEIFKIIFMMFAVPLSMIAGPVIAGWVVGGVMIVMTIMLSSVSIMVTIAICRRMWIRNF